VRPPESAWAYGVRINLDVSELFAGPQWIVVEFSPVAEAFGIGLLDRDDDFLARMQVPVSAVPVEAWLHVPDPAMVGALVVQNWVAPLAAEILLRRAWTVRERHDDLAEVGHGISAGAAPATISHSETFA
jgi:hypothetical protein